MTVERRDRKAQERSTNRGRIARGVLAGMAAVVLVGAGSAQAGDDYQAGFEYELGRITAQSIATLGHLVFHDNVRVRVVEHRVKYDHGRKHRHGGKHVRHARHAHRHHVKHHRNGRRVDDRHYRGRHYRKGHDRHGHKHDLHARKSHGKDRRVSKHDVYVIHQDDRRDRHDERGGRDRDGSRNRQRKG